MFVFGWLSPEVTDEEKKQNKAFNFCFEVLHCRGMADPDTDHAKHNINKNASKAAEIDIELLKLTLCCSLFVLVYLL